MALRATPLDKFCDEGLPTVSSQEQERVEEDVGEMYEEYRTEGKGLGLHRKHHEQYLLSGLKHLSAGYESLDASRPWLCYWILQSLDLLGVELETRVKRDVADFLSRCQDPNGGFGGGPGQLPHLAPTYAATLSLMILGTEEAYRVINREKLYQFLLSCKSEDGSFHMHHDGEIDVRGSYCAMHVAFVTNILTPQLAENVGSFLARAQSFDGGIGALPGLEAHGGYTFCGLAALALIGETGRLDIQRMLDWAVHRQMRYEGGFQGRTNKLVDGCYSFWQGGVHPILHAVVTGTLPHGLGNYSYHHIYRTGGAAEAEFADTDVIRLPRTSTEGDMWFSQVALEEYVLLAGQEDKGGMRDKPGKSRDYYHTCYCLSGLAVAQHNIDGSTTVVGDSLLQPLDPVLAVTRRKADRALAFFRSQPPAV